jgi:uncharacterized protein (TIGR02391 family)
MEQEQFIQYLKEYQKELETIISRFSKNFEGYHFYEGDDDRFHEIIIELRDLCDDAFGQNSYSGMIIDYYNDGMANLLRIPSYDSVNKITGVIRALIKRLERNRTLLEDRKFTLIDDGLPSLLHSTIIEHAYQHFKNGHYREAVLNSIVAIFDFIRARTGLQEDGSDLIGKALSTQNPYLILSELNTESGRNDQVGFLQIFQGAYKGIRNPKAHSLTHDLNKYKAAQYLVFASLLARRIEEASEVIQEDNRTDS